VPNLGIYRLDFNLFETLVTIIEEALKIENLPALLTSEIVCERLQFVEHHILDIVFIKKRFYQEAVLAWDPILIVYIMGSPSVIE
jgi:hypothetical protein